MADDKSRKSSGRGVTQAPSGPVIPETVADLVGRIFSQAPKAAAVPSARHSIVGQAGMPEAKTALSTGHTAERSLAGILAGSKINGKPTSAPVGNLALEPPVLKGGELLASNLSSEARHRAIVRGFQISSSHSFATLGALLTSLTLPSDMSASEARAYLQEIAPEASIGVNQRYRLYTSSNEDEDTAGHGASEFARETGGCISERCYGTAIIGWKSHLAKCAKDIRIGVIDTGIDMTHPALKRHRIYVGKIGPTNRVASSELHGTGVLALLAGDTRSSTPGLIPGAAFYVADIFFPDEKGQPVSTTMHLLAALEWMAQLDVHIVNLSLSGPRDALVQGSIAAMSQPRKTPNGTYQIGTVFVAAAGNGGPGAAPSYPAAYSEVVAVTAVSKDLRSYRRANHGDYIDVAAPGVNIWTALPDGRQGFQSGTSFATPYMTAVVAAIYRGLSDTKSKEELLQHISTQDLGAPGRDRVYGRGLVQAPAGCEMATRPRPRVLAAPWTTTHTPASASSVDLWAVTVARSPSH